MTTHIPLMTSATAPLAFPSRSWVMNSTLFYTALTLPLSLILPSLALPAPFADMTSTLGPHTPHSNKRLFFFGPPPLNSFTNTTKHGLILPQLHAHNSSTHSNLTVSNTNPQPLPGPYRPLPPLPPLLQAPPLMIHSARCVKVSVTRKNCFSLTYVTLVGTWTASSLAGIWKCPLCTTPAPSCQGQLRPSASPLLSLTLTLNKHRLGGKKIASLVSTEQYSQGKKKHYSFQTLL